MRPTQFAEQMHFGNIGFGVTNFMSFFLTSMLWNIGLAKMFKLWM